MEARFGHDFGNVRVHTDGRTGEAADALGALAFTRGNDIGFGAGRYAPDTPSGQRLLAHELAHVAQGSHLALARVDGTHESPAGDNEVAALEHEANAAATDVSAGRNASVRQRASSPHILRQSAAPASTTPPRPAREVRRNIGRGGRHRMDAELDRMIGWLTAVVKVKFNATNVPRPWPTPAHFTRFQTRFMQTVEDRWSFKHYLVPQRECPGEPQRVAVRVRLVPVTSNQHFTVNVGYSEGLPNPRSSVGGSTVNLDSQDDRRRNDIPQTPGEHEFGHMLGLGHIRCDRNDDECYGVSSDELADVMGSGSYVSPRDYEPFAEAMRYFNECNWNVSQASQVPTSRGPGIGGAIGFLLGGLGGAALGASLGGLLGPIGAIAGGLIGLVGGAIGGYFAGRALGTPRIPS